MFQYYGDLPEELESRNGLKVIEILFFRVYCFLTEEEDMNCARSSSDSKSLL